MDRPGDQLLAGARLALDDQRERRGGHPRDLRPQLLARAGLGAEAAVVHESRPVQAARVPGGVAQLVQGRVSVGVLRRELAALGQHHPVVLEAVAGAVARDVVDPDAAAPDQRVGTLVPLPLRPGRLQRPQLSHPPARRGPAPAATPPTRRATPLGDVTETATSRTVREDLEAALPPSVTAADLGDRGSRASVLDRIVRQWNRTEARAAAKLTHTHAVVRRKVGESVAHLAVLRGDDPIRTRASIRRRWRTA